MYKTFSDLKVESFSKGTIHKFWLNLVVDSLGEPLSVPVILARGKKEGKTLGITAVIHGNELNGISVIQRLFKEINLDNLRGTIIGIPVANVPSYRREKRRFIDDVDLNHVFPGKKNGSVSQIYAYHLFERVIRKFDYLIDLHTASFGRINSYYVRADLNDPITKSLAVLQHAQIIVNNDPSDGTLRGAASDIGIPSITLEVGNPNTFQKGMIRSGLTGLHNALTYLNMIEEEIEQPKKEAVICKKSYWIFTEWGGLLTVKPEITQMVEKGDLVAVQHNVFGDRIMEYYAPERGVIIGKSTNPVNQTGGRILHLGVLE